MTLDRKGHNKKCGKLAVSNFRLNTKLLNGSSTFLSMKIFYFRIFIVQIRMPESWGSGGEGQDLPI